MSDQRTAVLRRIAAKLIEARPGHPLRVGIDGVCGAGKTTFARELSAELAANGRRVVHLDSDGFHHVRARRHRQGRNSARGYYDDAYDFASLVAKVLLPLGPGGSLEYAVRVHDLGSDATITDETAHAPPDAIVVFDATFVQRGSLRAQWDEVIFLDSDLDAAADRGVGRDRDALGGPDAARAAYDNRYMAACRLYLSEQQPRERASIVVEHSDPAAPVLVRID